jgi:hypothetical protein
MYQIPSENEPVSGVSVLSLILGNELSERTHTRAAWLTWLTWTMLVTLAAWIFPQHKQFIIGALEFDSESTKEPSQVSRVALFPDLYESNSYTQAIVSREF